LQARNDPIRATVLRRGKEGRRGPMKSRPKWIPHSRNGAILTTRIQPVKWRFYFLAEAEKASRKPGLWYRSGGRDAYRLPQIKEGDLKGVSEDQGMQRPKPRFNARFEVRIWRQL